MTPIVPGECLLKRQLGFTVRVLRPLRRILVDGHDLGLAIGGAGR